MKPRASKPRLDGIGRALVDDAFYYVQDSRQIVGNCMLWWCPDGKGYACDIRQAGQYPGRAIRDLDEVHVGWPVEFVLENISQHVRRDIYGAQLDYKRRMFFRDLEDREIALDQIDEANEANEAAADARSW